MRSLLATWFPRVRDILITIGSHNLLAAPSRAMLDDARLSVLAGAGHLANIEDPGAFNRLLLEHLTTRPAVEVA